MQKDSLGERLTVDIPTAARMLGIGRTLAYELARSGRFPVPVLLIGERRFVVPLEPLTRLARGEALPLVTAGAR